MRFGTYAAALAATSLIAGSTPGTAWAQQTQPPSSSQTAAPMTTPTTTVLEVPPPPSLTPYVPFPHLPAPPLDEANNGVGIAQQTARTRKLQGRVLWIDATANLDRINTTEKITALVKQIKAAGFNTIVLDVKPISGLTIYPSRYAPKMTVFTKQNVTRTLPLNFDPVAAFVAQTRAARLLLVASMNVFSEGHRDFGVGPGYQNPDWQTTLYEVQALIRGPFAGTAVFPLAREANRAARTDEEIAVYTNLARMKPPVGAIITVVGADRRVLAQIDGPAFAALAPSLPTEGSAVLVGNGRAGDFLRRNAPVGQTLTLETAPLYVPISQRPEQQVPLITNPHHPAVRQRINDMAAEVVRNYAVDGVIFDDRLRYAGINADFSPDTRRQFEQYMGKSLRWPDDVFRWEITFPAMTRRVAPGPHFDDWLRWRSLTTRNWLASAVATIKTIRPRATVSVYVGSWYGEYPNYGSNWAADDFAAGFRFLTPDYQKTGFAGLLDWITTGCYYSAATVAEAVADGKIPGASIEAAGQLSNRAVNDQTWVYAGIALSDFNRQPDALRRALQAAAASTQGIMVFDLSHNIEQFWPVFAEAFREPAQPPHAVPGLLAQVRAEHAAQKAAGTPVPPVIIYGGVPGTGF